MKVLCCFIRQPRRGLQTTPIFITTGKFRFILGLAAASKRLTYQRIYIYIKRGGYIVFSKANKTENPKEYHFETKLFYKITNPRTKTLNTFVHNANNL